MSGARNRRKLVADEGADGRGRVVSDMTILAPPSINPGLKPVEEFMAWTAPDPHLFRLLEGGPKQIMALVTETAKALKPRDKRQKTAYKYGVMKRLGKLMKRKSLKRFRGHLVCLPNWRPSEQMTARVATLICKFRGSVNQYRKRERKPSWLTSRSSAETTPVALPKKPNAVRRPVKPPKPIRPPMSAAEASAAAGALARMPRKKKKWSGWIGSTRCYRWMPIKLPNGDSVFAMGARRGRVVWSRVPGELPGGIKGVDVGWGVLPARRVKIVKNVAAVCLGSLKAGAKERPSVAKSAAARANGCMPCRPGKQRGRPRKTVTAV